MKDKKPNELQTVSQTPQNEAERLIEMAIDKNVPVESLERLLALRDKLRQEKAKEAYDRAMANFQRDCPVITKNATAGNASYGYKYATLEHIVSSVKKLLAENGFSYTFDTQTQDGKLIVYCYVKHIAGHSESSQASIAVDSGSRMNVSQKDGSAMTYGKRYAFVNAFGILTGDEDTDANTPPKSYKGDNGLIHEPIQEAETTDFKPSYNTETLKEKAWCAVHTKSYIGRKKDGSWFSKCVQGAKTGEDCDIRIESQDSLEKDAEEIDL